MKKTLLICLAAVMTVAASAQSTKETLEKAIEKYNALTTYSDELTAKTITENNLADIKKRMESGIFDLNKVISEGNTEQINAARYFKANIQYEYGFALAMKAQNAAAYEVFKSIEPTFAGYTAANFPIRYAYFDKNFIVEWNYFAGTQADFFATFGETCYNLKKYGEAAKVIRLALAHPNSGNWVKYVGIHEMIDISIESAGIVSETERMNYYQESIKHWEKMQEGSVVIITKEANYFNTQRGMDGLLQNALNKNDKESAGRCADVLPILVKWNPEDARVLQMLEICYKNSLPGDRSFTDMAYAYAVKMKTAEPTRARFVAIAATDRMAFTLASDDCAGFARIAQQYDSWNATDMGDKYRSVVQKCEANKRSAEKKAAKAAKRANSEFNMYFGAYLLPLVNTNPKRDYGGVVNFAFERTALEFSFLKINRNKETIFDLWIAEVENADQGDVSRWDGFYAHFQPKFYNSEQSFKGFILGYAQKNFDTQTANITEDATGAYSTANFKPAVKQYLLMYNAGITHLVPGYGVELYYGLGVAYSRFDAGTSIDRDAYTIDNPLLESRKPGYFSPVFRAGVTMGINLGKGRD